MLTQMFEYHGQPHNKKCYTQEEWGALKAAGNVGEFGGGLPQANIMVNNKKVNMGQGFAILRSFGIRYGYYNPKDWKCAMFCDSIVETWGDVVGGMGKVFFAPDADKPALMTAYVDGVCTKFMGLCEKTLAKHGGKFIASNSVTIADFVMSAFIHNMLQNQNAPHSALLQAKVSAFPKFCDYVKVNNAEFAAHIKARGAVGPG